MQVVLEVPVETRGRSIAYALLFTSFPGCVLHAQTLLVSTSFRILLRNIRSSAMINELTLLTLLMAAACDMTASTTMKEERELAS